MIVAVALAIAYNIRARGAQATSSPPSQSTNKPSRSEPISVKTVVAKVRSLEETLQLNGIVRSDDQTSVTSTMPAKIISVLVKEGDHVSAGQALITLSTVDLDAEARSAEAGIVAAKAQVRKAESGLVARRVEMNQKVAEADGGLLLAQQRLKQASTGGSVSNSAAQADVQRARSGVLQAQAGLDQADISVKQAAETHARLERLLTKGGIPKVDVDGAKTQLDVARAQQREAREGLEQAKASEYAAVEAAKAKPALNDSDVAIAKSGVKQAEQGIASAKAARTAAMQVAQRDVDSARAALAQAQTGMETLNRKRAESTIRASSVGTVSSLTARAGDFAQPGMPLMTLVGQKLVFVEVSVPSRAAGAIRVGQSVTVEPTNGARINARVSAVLPSSPSDGRSVPVRITLPTGANGLSVGASAFVNLTMRHSATTTVPSAAIRETGSEPTVFMVKDDKAVEQHVQVGTTVGSMVQVINGLSEGDQVVIEAPSQLKAGAPVRSSGASN
jgi:RND family efflux transporter MFP subunit